MKVLGRYRDAIWRLLCGCAAALMLATAGIGAQLVPQQKPKPKPPTTMDEDIYLSCLPCWWYHPEWVCRWIWNCPPKPPDLPPPPQEGQSAPQPAPKK